MPDQLSVLYSEFLDGGYDCVDRVILNAYFSMGQSGGGLRRAGDPERSRICGGAGAKSQSRIYQTRELLHFCE